MSFLNITDPKKRDAIVADYLATIKRIKNRNLQERVQDFIHHETIEQSLKPVVQSTAASTAAITKELVPIKEGITALNTKLTQQQQQQQPQQQQQSHKVGVEVAEEEDEEEKSNTFEQLVKRTPHEKLDEYFGIVRTKVDGQYRMGNEMIQVDNDDIVVGGLLHYKGTPGLWRLIMLKKPERYTTDDLHTYQRLVEQTHAMEAPNNVRTNSKIKSTYKWRAIFSKFEGQQHGGSGIQFLPTDINALQTKLSYLLGEFRAGNNLATRNEIVAIADNLLRRKRLSRAEYRKINNFLQ